MDSAADLPKITQALLDRGYNADDIQKILGGNLLRVFREVERVSARDATWRSIEVECRSDYAGFLGELPSASSIVQLLVYNAQ